MTNTNLIARNSEEKMKDLKDQCVSFATKTKTKKKQNTERTQVEWWCLE